MPGTRVTKHSMLSERRLFSDYPRRWLQKRDESHYKERTALASSSLSLIGGLTPREKVNRQVRGGPSERPQPKGSGGDIEEVTPDPIPNSEVKLFGADGTARET